MKEYKNRKTRSSIAIKALYQNNEKVNALKNSKFWNNCVGIFKRICNLNYMKEIIYIPTHIENKATYICNLSG